MKVAVIGANGQLGTDLVEVFREDGNDVVALTHEQIRVEEMDSVSAALSVIKPRLILNTAAYHNVPVCEEHPETAFAVNAQGAYNVARAAADLDSVNVYYSTDYVFDGEKRRPYVEDDLPNPLNVYAASKLAGEHLSSSYSPRSFVVRISGIYGEVPCRAKGESFVTKMIRFASERPEVRVVTDEVLTPTPTREIARKTVPLVACEAYGVHHLTCEGACSWYEFAREIFDFLKLGTPLHEASVEDFPSPVRRPFYSVLDNRRFNALDVARMPDWRSALREFLRGGDRG